jgi:hypothetical protein
MHARSAKAAATHRGRQERLAAPLDTRQQLLIEPLQVRRPFPAFRRRLQVARHEPEMS